MSKVDALRKLNNKVIDSVCENLIEELSLKHDVRNTFNVKLSIEQLKPIRETAIARLRDLTTAQAEEIIVDEDLNNKFIELKKLSTHCKKGRDGWRPSGSPTRDSVGSHFSDLLSHIDRLTKLKAQMQELLTDEEVALQKLHV